MISPEEFVNRSAFENYLVENGVHPDTARLRAFPEGKPSQREVEEQAQREAADRRDNQLLGQIAGLGSSVLLTDLVARRGGSLIGQGFNALTGGATSSLAGAGQGALAGLTNIGASGTAALGSAAGQGAVTGLAGLGSQAGQQVATQGASSLGNAAANAASQGAATGLTAVNSASPLASTASLIGNAAGLAGGLYGAYQLYDNFGTGGASGRLSGALGGAGLGGLAGGAKLGGTLGSFIPIPGVGTAAGALAGALLGLGVGSIKTGKHEDQQTRDAVREELEDSGIVEYRLRDDGSQKSHYVTLADGTQYDIGIDGIEEGVVGEAYNVDFNDPRAAQVAAWLDPLTTLYTGGDDDASKPRTDLTGYLVNAALSNTSDLEGARENVLKFYRDFGLEEQQAIQAGLGGLVAEENLTDNQTAILGNSVNTLFGGQYTDPTTGQNLDLENIGEQDVELSPTQVQELQAQQVNTIGSPVAQALGAQQGFVPQSESQPPVPTQITPAPVQQAPVNPFQNLSPEQLQQIQQVLSNSTGALR